MGDEDKQYDATPRKLEQARKEGQVVKSKDFSTAVSLLILFSAIFGLAPFIWNQITQLFTLLYEQIPNAHLNSIGLSYIFMITVKAAVLIIAPILALAWFVAVMADFIQVGPLVATAPLMPKLDKLNPTKYFKNIMSIKAFHLNDLFSNRLDRVQQEYVDMSLDYNKFSILYFVFVLLFINRKISSVFSSIPSTLGYICVKCIFIIFISCIHRFYQIYIL